MALPPTVSVGGDVFGENVVGAEEGGGEVAGGEAFLDEGGAAVGEEGAEAAQGEAGL